jgi:hypothetical protein
MRLHGLGGSAGDGGDIDRARRSEGAMDLALELLFEGV